MLRLSPNAIATLLLFSASAATANPGGTCDSATGDCDKYGITASNITGCLPTETSPHRPTYTPETFVTLRNIYRKVYDQYPTVMNRIEKEEAGDRAGIVVPFEHKLVPGEAYRGVFTKEKVAEGDPVWSPLFFGMFHTEESWLAFLYAIMSDLGREETDLGRFLACDALQWSYVVETDDDEFAAVLDLDEGSFVNHGFEDEDDGVNIVDSTLGVMVADRDIEAGEQIKMDYTTVYEYGELEWYEASVAKAWDVDRSNRDEDDEEEQWHYR